jgi:predicted PurR-regulated permease PerM
VAILLGVFVWGKLLGFLGVILAIPLTCLGIAYYRRYVLNKSGARVVDSTPAEALRGEPI